VQTDFVDDVSVTFPASEEAEMVWSESLANMSVGCGNVILWADLAITNVLVTDVAPA
jgi:hypothetical protein